MRSHARSCACSSLAPIRCTDIAITSRLTPRARAAQTSSKLLSVESCGSTCSASTPLSRSSTSLAGKLYAELQAGAPHFHPVWINRAFLFVSSPGAMVYLHADYQPNILWHLRGNKTIWIYPAYDPRIVSLERMEEICAGGEDDIDFRHEFDAYGQAFHIGPGETVSWPARAPHRVINGDTLNVSLSTFHETVEDYDRVVEHRSDYLLRTKMPAARGLMRLVGAPGKRLAYRAMERAGWVQGRPVKEYWASLRIDPESPSGVSEIPRGPVLTEHSRLVKQASQRLAA